MKHISFITLIIFSLINVDCSDHEKSQNPYFLTKANPFFTRYNQPIDFASITANHVSEAVEMTKNMTQEALAQIVGLREKDRNFENTMRAYDEMFANFHAIASPIYLMAYTHPDSAIRNQAQEANTALSQFGNEISLNEDLYKAIKSYSNRMEVDQLKSNQ